MRRRTKPPDPDPGDVTDVEVEIDPEHEWRMQRFVNDLGFTSFQAFRLSINGADWHQAKSMLDAGADPQHVVDILI